jgi:hypothetical protein
MLSLTSKLGCYSWSLEAWDYCPGSQDAAGEPVDACRFCYARNGFYRMPTVKAKRAANLKDFQLSDWVDRMVAALQKETHFRWFDSGDMFSLPLAEKIYAVMQQTPHVKHWLPTRMHKFDKFKPIIWDMQQLPNVVVRLSSDSVGGEVLTNTITSSTIIPDKDFEIDAYKCPAYNQGGKCLDCRACWSKDVPVIAYVYHGQSKAKVIKILQAKG